LRKSADEAYLPPPAVCSGANRVAADQVPRCMPPADYCPRFITFMQETLLPHAVLTLDASQENANSLK